MNFLRILLNNLTQFFQKRENLFFLLGISFFPILSICRILISSLFSTETSSWILFFFMLTGYIVLILMVFSYENVNQSLISFCVYVANFRMTQRILLFFLLLEQFFLIHPVILCSFCFCGSIFLLAFDCLFNPYISTPLQLLFVLVLFYLRIRKKLLNTLAFADAGVFLHNEPLHWNTLFLGLNAVLTKQFSTQHVSTLANRQTIPKIHNQFPERSNLMFPFFPNTLRKNVSFKAAAMGFFETIKTAYNRAPLETTGTLVAISGTFAGAAVFVGHDLAQSRQNQIDAEEDRKIQREILRQSQIDAEEDRKIQREILRQSQIDAEEDRKIQREILRSIQELKVPVESNKPSVSGLLFEPRIESQPPQLGKQEFNQLQQSPFKPQDSVGAQSAPSVASATGVKDQVSATTSISELSYGDLHIEANATSMRVSSDFMFLFNDLL